MWRTVILSLLATLLAACGGGGSSDNTNPTPNTPQNQAPTGSLTGDSTMPAGSSRIFQLQASDEDGEIINIEWAVEGPLDIEATTGNAQFLSNISGSKIEASGAVIAFGSSDERLKDNITYIQQPIDKINKIGGYKFTWNDKQDTYLGKDVGVLAQEIEAVLPELVTTRATGYKAVKYEKIVPLLIEGIKELDKKIKHIEKNCDCLNK